jgi:alpha-L-rhamnosidase
MGIDVKVPRFSWALSHSGRGVSQSAYQIQLSCSEERLFDDAGDVWDSGRVESRASVNVSFDGGPLETRRK